jgi:hypothetical protein
MTQEVTFNELLAQAAKLASEAGCDLDGFMKAAWSSYVDATPGLRERIELQSTMAQLAMLRERGLVASA